MITLLGLLLLVLCAIQLIVIIRQYKKLRFHENVIDTLERDAENIWEEISEGKLQDQKVARIIEKICVTQEKKVRTEYIDTISGYLILQNQINPHFLYNTLDSLRGQALSQGNEEVAEMAEMLAKFYRYCISAQDSQVTLRDEIENVNYYYYIQHYRFGDRIKLVVEIDKELLDFYVPKLTLQPIIENAINHGLRKKREGGTVTIRALKKADELIIVVSDDGVGMEQSIVDQINFLLQEKKLLRVKKEAGKGNGVALYNVNERIKLYFGEQYGMRIHSTLMQGTDVYLYLPVADVLQVSKLREGKLTNDK